METRHDKDRHSMLNFSFEMPYSTIPTMVIFKWRLDAKGKCERAAKAIKTTTSTPERRVWWLGQLPNYSMIMRAVGAVKRLIKGDANENSNDIFDNTRIGYLCDGVWRSGSSQACKCWQGADKERICSRNNQSLKVSVAALLLLLRQANHRRCQRSRS